MEEIFVLKAQNDFVDLKQVLRPQLIVMVEETQKRPIIRDTVPLFRFN